MIHRGRSTRRRGAAALALALALLGAAGCREIVDLAPTDPGDAGADGGGFFPDAGPLPDAALLDDGGGADAPPAPVDGGVPDAG